VEINKFLLFLWEVLQSNRKIFRGLSLLFVASVSNADELPEKLKSKRESFEYFMRSLEQEKLQEIQGESVDVFDV